MDVGKRFELHRETDATGVSGVGVVAEGMQFRDGRVALRWLTTTASSALYDSMEHVQAIHGHEGATSVVWVDSDEPCACSVAPAEQAQEENLADLSKIDLSVGGPARVGQVEVCDETSCETAHFLVRGDMVSFVSTERAKDLEKRHADKRADLHRLPHLMPSDITIPRGFVLAHDATGRLLSKCDVYVLRWRAGGVKAATNIHEKDLAAARDYYGNSSRISGGSLEIPAGKWSRVARVRVVRYRRSGFSNAFAHRYDPPVDLFMCSRPLAWRIALPEGCVVDSRGFVRP